MHSLISGSDEREERRGGKIGDLATPPNSCQYSRDVSISASSSGGHQERCSCPKGKPHHASTCYRGGVTASEKFRRCSARATAQTCCQERVACRAEHE